LKPESGVRGRSAGAWTLFPSSDASTRLLRRSGKAQHGYLSWYGLFADFDWVDFLVRLNQSIRDFTGYSAPTRLQK
jgi:hypothetical protein